MLSDGEDAVEHDRAEDEGADHGALPSRLSSPAVVPPTGEIEELIRLAQIGYVRGIDDRLSAIERAGDYRDFVSYMRVLTDGFDLKRCIAVLESVRSSHG